MKKILINIKDNSNIKALNFVDAKATRITYSENMEFALPKPENKDQLSFFRRFCCCCCDKTNNNKEPELNAKTLHEFKNIENIVTN